MGSRAETAASIGRWAEHLRRWGRSLSRIASIRSIFTLLLTDDFRAEGEVPLLPIAELASDSFPEVFGKPVWKYEDQKSSEDGESQ